ncbi:hypothetical protein Hanom_Chr09g00767241 [Helianthus anomalus]
MIWVQFEKTFERLNMFTNLPGVTNKVCEYKIIFSVSQNPLSFPADPPWDYVRLYYKVPKC